MKTNEAGVRLIKDFEKLELVGYLCPAGVPTAGWGHTAPDVVVGKRYSQGQAESWLAEDLDKFEREVWRRCSIAPTPNQFSAMVSLCFNIGAGNFAKSSVLRNHNAGAYAKAAECFLMWNKATSADGTKRELKGLTRRRAAEAVLYMTPEATEEAADPQRTRAADVEPTAATPPQISTGTIVTGAAGVAVPVAGLQAVTQAKTVWQGLVDAGVDPHLILATLGVVAVATLIGLGWKMLQARRVAG